MEICLYKDLKYLPYTSDIQYEEFTDINLYENFAFGAVGKIASGFASNLSSGLGRVSTGVGGSVGAGAGKSTKYLDDLFTGLAPGAKGLDDLAPGAKGLDDLAPGAKGLDDLAPGAKGVDDLAPGAKGVDDLAPGAKGVDEVAGTGNIVTRNYGKFAAAIAAGAFIAATIIMAEKLFDDTNGKELYIRKILILDLKNPKKIQITISSGLKFFEHDTVKFKNDTLIIFPKQIRDPVIIDIISSPSDKEIIINIPELETTKTLGTIIVNNKVLDIISMEILDSAKPDNIVITYNKTQTIKIDDKIIFKNSSDMDDTVTINKIISNKKINVTITNKFLGKTYTLGTLILNRTLEDCINATAKKNTSDVIDNEATRAVGAVVGGATEGIFGGLFGGLFGGAGGIVGSITKWIIIIIIVIALIFFIKFLMGLKK
jgi:hypothetical protein